MTSEEIKNKLTEIFRTTFKDPDLEIFDTMTVDDVPAWDSLSHINLIMSTEKAFGIRMNMREIRGLDNVGSLIKLLEQKTAS